MTTMSRHQKNKILVIIPARAGSKRIPGKNIRKFLGQPLIAYTIKQALSLKFVERVIVDTDSPKIAKIARQYGAEVPFLRPAYLAKHTAQVVDSILNLIKKLQEDEGYAPKYVMILQTTSPLREIKDIEECWKLIKSTNATTVLTVCPTHPRLYHLDKDNYIELVNGSEEQSTNTQAWKPGYILNGTFVDIIKTTALLRERRIITKKTKAVVCSKWRSVDLDTPEDWVLAEILYKNKKNIASRIKKI